MLVRPTFAASSLTLLLAAGCGGGEDDDGKKGGPGPRDAPKQTSRPLAFAQVAKLPLGTPRSEVVRRFGPPVRRQRVKPYGVVSKCFRYGAVNDTTGRLDPDVEFRLCYNRRDRLSLKSTAPPG